LGTRQDPHLTAAKNTLQKREEKNLNAADTGSEKLT
jgi:hypothetical protein